MLPIDTSEEPNTNLILILRAKQKENLQSGMNIEKGCRQRVEKEPHDEVDSFSKRH